MPMDNNKLIARFQELTLFPDDRLFSIYQTVTGEVSSNRHQVIRDLAVNENVTWSYETNPEDAAKADGIKDLIKYFPRIFSKSWNYTHCSWKRDIDRVYDVSDEKIVMFKNPHRLKADMLWFINWYSVLLGADADREKECQTAGEAFLKFKDRFFTLVDKTVVDTFTLNIAMDACSAIANENGASEQVCVVSGYAESVRRYIVSTSSDKCSGGDFDGNNEEHRAKIMEKISPMMEERVVDEDIPGMPDLNTHLGGLPTDSVPDVEEAPTVQTTTEDVVTQENAHLSVKIIKDVEEAKQIRETLDNFASIGATRKIAINKITKNSWKKFRKEHGLGGRCEVYVKSDPGVNPKQNKCFKYCVGHVCDESYEGCEPDMMPTGNGEGDEVPTGTFSSVYPYGEVIIIALN
tara:strand:+ start:537 stop:1754 length:1218 start_codon:yes stop_codon:yes gene_type:complete